MTKTSNKRFRAIFSAAVLTAALVSAGASAQDVSESHLSAARSAITALKATDPFDNILLTSAESLKARIIANNPDLENEISLIVDEQTLVLAARRGDLENEAARIYATSFSEEDLNAISTFYATEAGQNLLQKGSIAAREIGIAATIWARGVDRDLLNNVVAAMNEAGLRANTDIGDPPADGTATATEGGATQN